MFRQFLTSIQLPSVGRSLRGITVGLLLMMPIVAVFMRNEGEAQNSRLQQDVTETPTPTLPFMLPSFTPTIDPLATGTFTPDPFAPTIDPFIPTVDPLATPDPFAQTPFNPEATVEPTAFPTATPVIEPETVLLLDAVTDMNLLADAVLGGGVRPEGWNGSQDPFNTELPVQTRSDLETLASALVANAELRPRDWIGAVGSTPFAIARDVRHDVELVADLVYGYDTRPETWTGADPLMRCNRGTQTLVALLERGGVFTLDIDANDPQFCHNAELAVTQFTDEQILANTEGELFADNIAILAENTVEGDLAIAFLDSAATGQVGIIPDGTPIQVLGRSNAEFSRMMLVSGDSFQVYVDYQNTTVTAEQFRSLPNAESLNIETGCFAEWCDSN